MTTNPKAALSPHLQSRARDRSKFRAQRMEAKAAKDRRVVRIFMLMTANQWVDGRSELELSEEWGKSRATIEANADEAKRLVRLSHDRSDHADRVARFVAGLQEQMRQCVKERNHRDFARIAQIYADVTGLNAPTKVEVSGSLGDLLSLGLAGDTGGAGTDPEVAEKS